MLTWAICWLTSVSGGSEGIAYIILFAMILDATIILSSIGIVCDTFRKIKEKTSD